MRYPRRVSILVITRIFKWHNFRELCLCWGHWNSVWIPRCSCFFPFKFGYEKRTKSSIPSHSYCFASQGFSLLQKTIVQFLPPNWWFIRQGVLELPSWESKIRKNITQNKKHIQAPELLDHFATNRGEHKPYLKFHHLSVLSFFFRTSGAIVPSSATAMQLPEMPKRHSWRALWSTGAVEKTIERYIWANYYKNWFIQTWFGITQLYSWICFRSLEKVKHIIPNGGLMVICTN